MKIRPNSGNLIGFPVSAEQGVAWCRAAQPEVAGIFV
jgi:hypothetical protein